jgi:hypothetical protein
MSDQDAFRSARDVDVDAERFLDDDGDGPDVPNVVDLPPDGSIHDIVDQRTEVPEDDEP